MSRHRVLSLIGAGVLIVACGDPYMHTNPYDPVFPVEIDISGPDSIFSYEELAQYSAQTTPMFPDSAVTWLVDTFTLHRPGPVDTSFDGMTLPLPNRGDTIVEGTSYFTPSTPGTFQSFKPPLEPTTLTVTIEALLGAVDTTVSVNGGLVDTKTYRHTAYKKVVLTQRVTHVQLRCPDTHACDTLAVGGTWSVWVDGFDALGHGILALADPAANPPGATPVATFTSRDTTVASVSPVNIRAANVTALKAGTTWVVATRGLLSDSVLVVAK
ncbi:MAG TPA: hypothetical protein VGI97_05165 [Gemmatimonadaceae bacterium]